MVAGNCSNCIVCVLDGSIPDSDKRFTIDVESAPGEDKSRSDKDGVFSKVARGDQRQVVKFRFQAKVGLEIEVGKCSDALDGL